MEDNAVAIVLQNAVQSGERDKRGAEEGEKEEGEEAKGIKLLA